MISPLVQRVATRVSLLTLLTACGGADGWGDGIDTRPAALTLLAGDGATGAAGAPLEAPLVLRVTNAAGNGLQGKRVLFSSAVGVEFMPAEAVTDASGRTRVAVTLGPWVGPQPVTLRVAGGDLEEILVLTGELPAAVTAAVVDGQDQVGPVATMLPLPLQVRVFGSAASPLGGIAVEWETTAGSLSATSTTTSLNGIAQVALQLPSSPGPVTVTARVPVTGDVFRFQATATSD